MVHQMPPPLMLLFRVSFQYFSSFLPILYTCTILPKVPVTASSVSVSTADIIAGDTVNLTRDYALTPSVLSYSVRYGGVGSESRHTLSVSGSDRTEATILNLMSGTTYKVDVAAVNTMGTGNFSKKIPVMTLAEDQLVISESVDRNSHNTGSDISTEENGNSVGVTGLIAGVIFGVVVLVVTFITVVLLIM